MIHGYQRIPRPAVTIVFALALSTATFVGVPHGLASPVCVIPDNGSGTGDLPPVGCAYDDDTDTFKILNGLLPAGELHIDGRFESFLGIVRAAGGSLGGETENFQATMPMDINGIGAWLGYHRLVAMPLTCQVDAAPRVLATPIQSFAMEWMGLQGQLPPGDPDFDLLRITGGTNFGLPSPGHTTLTQVPGPQWNVDSFFDITYRIDFVGHPGGPFGGLSGSTTGTIRMQCGQPTNPTRTAAGTWGKLKIMYR